MDRKAMKKMFLSNKMAVVCTVLILIIVIASLMAPLSPYDPDASNVAEKMQGISSTHILGTDDIGRDTFTRTLYGGRISLLVGFAAMCVAVIVGTLFGTISGYMGGAVDAFMMRIVDVFMSVPSLLFIIVVYAFMPRNLVTLVGMLAFFSWTKVARVVRAQTLTLKELTAYPIVCMEKGTTTRKFWDSIFKHHGIELHPNIEVNSNDLIPPTVLHNLGIGFVPYKFARSFLLNYGLIQLSLDIVIPKREICIVQNPSHPLSPAAKTLLDMMITGNEYTEEQYSMENEHFHGDVI